MRSYTELVGLPRQGAPNPAVPEDCPSEWVLLQYNSRQYRGPVRLGDEVCFAKELTSASGEKRRERYAYLSLGPGLRPA